MTQCLPTGASWLSPYLMVSDVDKAAEFYKNAFTFEVKDLIPGEEEGYCHAELNYKGQLLMCGKEGAYGSLLKSPRSSGIESPMFLYLYCENVDEFYKHALAHGAESVSAPEDMFWGDRMCRLKDPDHYVWCFATLIPGQHKS